MHRLSAIENPSWLWTPSFLALLADHFLVARVPSFSIDVARNVTRIPRDLQRGAHRFCASF